MFGVGVTERQARYRQARRGLDGPSERPVSVVLRDEAINALRRVSAHTGSTRRATLERLILAEQDSLFDRLDSEGQRRYLSA